MIGYLLILAPCTAIGYWFWSLHSTLGTAGAVFVGLFCLTATLFWRARRMDTAQDDDDGRDSGC